MSRCRTPRKPDSPPARRPSVAALPAFRAFVVVVVASACGCQGGVGPIRRWRAAGDSSLTQPITDEEVGDNRNMIARWLSPGGAPHTGGTLNTRKILTPTKPDPQTEAEIKAAEALYQQGKLAEAEAAFLKLDKKNVAAKGDVDDFKPDDGKLLSKIKAKSDPLFKGSNKPGSATWGEKVLFLLAECQYQQGHFVDAHETYQKLYISYPASPHLDTAVKRVYAIACGWLDADDPKAKLERPPAWSDHFDGRRPLIDVEGYAIKALEHIRVWDPEGPLCDDAEIKIADYFMKKADYENAAFHYDEVRKMPKSDLLRRAQIGSIDAKMKNYSGPEYDATGLEEARLTIRETLHNFPEREPGLTEELHHKLDLITDQMAHIAYNNGLFYKRTGYVSGAEYYFGEVRAKYPQSEWAKKSKVELASLAKAPRKKAEPSKILTLPGAPDPNAMGNSMGSQATMPGGGGMGGMGVPTGGMGP